MLPLRHLRGYVGGRTFSDALMVASGGFGPSNRTARLIFCNSRLLFCGRLAPWRGIIQSALQPSLSLEGPSLIGPGGGPKLGSQCRKFRIGHPVLIRELLLSFFTLLAKLLVHLRLPAGGQLFLEFSLAFSINAAPVGGH